MSTQKRVLVTGGSGKAGKWVIEHLLEYGYQVINADQKTSPLVRTYHVDLTDLGQTFGVVENKDAIIHLAAIPWPGEHTAEVVFRNNVMSTFNVLQAACVLGVKKVVLAGSESALGFPFMFRRFSPIYLPIDEDHPLLAQDAYGISKIVLEELAKGFVRRDPQMSIISLRLSYILQPQDYASELEAAWRDEARNDFNLWAYIDARDAAVACRLAMEYPQPGFEAFYIAAPDTLMKQPTLELVNRYYPGVQTIREGYGGRMSPLDCRKAKTLLGFQPRYVWQDVVPYRA
jgi:nucleoside-diphosphate-sugar epimerase